MSCERWIVVSRWDEFQHRDMARSNVPPWIKNFTKLMHDDSYLGLTGHQRAVLHGIWLEYASARRQLTLSTVSLSRRLHLRVTMANLESLNRAGFIEFSAIKPASSPASGPASLEVEVEKKPPTPFSPSAEKRPNANARSKGNGGPSLKFISQAQAVWRAAPQADRAKHVTVWLEGFTDDQALIDAHLHELERTAA